jgi:hypothetical protein
MRRDYLRQLTYTNKVRCTASNAQATDQFSKYEATTFEAQWHFAWFKTLKPGPRENHGAQCEPRGAMVEGSFSREYV